MPDNRFAKPAEPPSAATRKDERFELPTEILVSKVGPDGVSEKEERTIAHDLSRSGMRLLTSWADLGENDRVAIQEIGGTFSSGAIVRHVRRGTDQITRVGIEFLDNVAPDRLVGTTTGLARPTSVAPPQSAVAPLSRPAPTPRPAPPPAAAAALSPPSPAAPAPSEGILEEIAAARSAARELVAASKVWEALEVLGKAQGLATGTPAGRAVRIQTWETQARIPSLMRAAQHELEVLAARDPADAAAYSALGRIFFDAGLPARARAAFNHVLSIDPSNREATLALAALNQPAKPR